MEVSDSSLIRSGFEPNLNAGLFLADSLENSINLQMVNHFSLSETRALCPAARLSFRGKSESKDDSAFGGTL